MTEEQRPLYDIRTPGNEDEMHEVMNNWWTEPRFRSGVRKAFAGCESPWPYLMFEKVPDTDIWMTYVVDEGRHSITMVSIGRKEGLYYEENNGS